MATAVVTCFLRNDAEVLLFRRSETVGSYQGLWGGVAGHAEGDPDVAARREVREETGIDPETLAFVRAGDPFEVRDDEGEWLVHPYLFDCPTRAVEPNWETETHEWVPPTAILRRETVTDLWESYDRIRPRVETVAGDTEHGAAYLSVRALEVLRDEAALRVEGAADDSDGSGAGWQRLGALARELATARPAMPVVANRVDRAVHAADERTAAALEAAAEAGIERALRADGRAAASAAERAGGRVATLSRSGTVRETLARAEPDAVLVAESRPGREGVGVAEATADSLDAAVALTTDAAFPHQLVEWGADTLLVGADAVLPDGRVVNKAGTRGAALSAAREGVDVVVAGSVDKVRRDGVVDLEPRDPGEVYGNSESGDGVPDLDVLNPTFDVTPADAVTVVGEGGEFDPVEVAAAHRRRAAWRTGDAGDGTDTG
ncbi:NUDIX domain-containing protein [Salinirussus salinus]|jgi:translation initiation factor 2B subunit (eIF-2B alpha/beta/delta family)|uniref:NUDIX domain-containing protein n=1 Tax=Salinirussus salinus TaxID=1198300 RepID=UPI0013584F87|nr:NUDIX domain-containing protein [Salinirussus salinus]